METGSGTEAARRLMSFVERLESFADAKKEMGAEAAAVMAEAKAEGFIPKAIRRVLKVRAMRPQDRQEDELIEATYLHACGMLVETPVHKLVEALAVDRTSRDSVTEALKHFVPEAGSITVEMGGASFSLARMPDGSIVESDAKEKKRKPPKPEPRPAKPPGWEHARTMDPIDPLDAEAFGEAARDLNFPLTDNPFPVGHANRPDWARGWFRSSGGHL